MLSLEGKTILVSGGGTGIGRAAVLAFAAAGANVAIVGRRPGHLEETAAEIGDPKRTLVISADVSDRMQVCDLHRAVIARFGRIDGAMNNAAIFGPVVPIHEYPPEDFLEVLAVNTAGTMWAMQEQIKHMLTIGGGSIVNIVSAGALRITVNCSAYIAAKNAVIGLTRAAALEYSSRGIRVNMFSPGIIKSPMTAALTEERMTALSAVVPIGRLGEPEDMTGGLVWLFSDEARYVTGSNLFVDGGFALS